MDMYLLAMAIIGTLFLLVWGIAGVIATSRK
jgi:hypothetical protein